MNYFELMFRFHVSDFFNSKKTPEKYLEPCQTCKMKRFAKIVNGYDKKLKM